MRRRNIGGPRLRRRKLGRSLRRWELDESRVGCREVVGSRLEWRSSAVSDWDEGSSAGSTMLRRWKFIGSRKGWRGLGGFRLRIWKLYRLRLRCNELVGTRLHGTEGFWWLLAEMEGDRRLKAGTEGA